jgi:hypothetical protein
MALHRVVQGDVFSLAQRRVEAGKVENLATI